MQRRDFAIGAIASAIGATTAIVTPDVGPADQSTHALVGIWLSQPIPVPTGGMRVVIMTLSGDGIAQFVTPAATYPGAWRVESDVDVQGTAVALLPPDSIDRPGRVDEVQFTVTLDARHGAKADLRVGLGPPAATDVAEHTGTGNFHGGTVWRVIAGESVQPIIDGRGG